MTRPSDLPELLGLARASVEVLAVVWLVGQFVLQGCTGEDGARAEPADDRHWADLRQPHAGDALPEEDDEVGEGEGGQAGEASEEHINIAWEICEAALAHQTAQLRRSRRSQCRCDRAQRIAQDADATHIHVVALAQVLGGCTAIQGLWWGLVNQTRGT